MMTKFFFVFVTILFYYKLAAQTVFVQGRVVDTMGQGLSFANIIADPVDSTMQVLYNVADEKGFFKIRLIPNKTYRLSASYIGYTSEIVKLKVTRDTTVQFVLKIRPEELDEVIIVARKAIDVKKDTITFRASSFLRGGERKLRDLIKNVPGMAVDAEGNVKFQGRRVSTVLVENREFFTGQTKFATNNIPAEVVKEIQILDNYHETAFMKNVENTDAIALNINLKDDKKEFWFGSIQAGGFKKFYLAYLSLFKFSEKNQITLIGNTNNANKEVMTAEDFNLLDSPTKDYDTKPVSVQRPSTLYNLFQTKNRDKSEEKFVGVGIKRYFQKSGTVSSYFLINKSAFGTFESQLRYPIGIDSLFNKKNTLSNGLNWFMAGKLEYRNYSKYRHDIKGGILFKTMHPQFNRQITNETFLNNQVWSFLANNNSGEWTMFLNLKKRFKDVYISTLSFEYKRSDEDYLEDRFTDSGIVNPFLAMVPGDSIFLKHSFNQKGERIHLLAKHFFSYREARQLIFELGVDAFGSIRHAELIQNRGDSIVSLLPFNMTQPHNMRYKDLYFGLKWRAKIRRWTGYVGFKHHENTWNYFALPRKKNVAFFRFLEPLAELRYKGSNSNLVKLNYSYGLSLPKFNKLWNIYQFNDYYYITLGGGNYYPVREHLISLSFFKFNMYNRTTFNLLTSVSFKPKVFLEKKEFSQMFTFGKYFFINLPSEKFMFLLSYGKWNNLFSVRGNLIYIYVLSNSVNNRVVQTFSVENMMLNSAFSSRWSKKYPQLDFHYNVSIIKYKTFQPMNNLNHYWNTTVHYQVGNWFFSLSYKKEFLKSQSLTPPQIYAKLNGLVRYTLPSKKWTFELNGSNLLNVRHRYEQNIKADWFMIRSEAVFPRVIMLKAMYDF